MLAELLTFRVTAAGKGEREVWISVGAGTRAAEAQCGWMSMDVDTSCGWLYPLFLGLV